jgi:serine/threonine-protein kinase RsbW
MQHKYQAYAYHEVLMSDCPKEGWRRWEVRELSEVRPIVRQLEGEMRDLAYLRKDSFAVGLVLLEAVSNAIRHGHQHDKSRTVLINYHVSQDKVLMEVIDEGLGFDPSVVPNPLSASQPGERTMGWGLLLIRVYMSWVRFNKRGNRVVLCKNRSLS